MALTRSLRFALVVSLKRILKPWRIRADDLLTVMVVAKHSLCFRWAV